VVLIASGGLYIYTSAMFERIKPTIVLENDTGYWNLKKQLNLKIDDASGIKSYKVTIHLECPLTPGSSPDTTLYTEVKVNEKLAPMLPNFKYKPKDLVFI
jgi:hypothetical protein